MIAVLNHCMQYNNYIIIPYSTSCKLNSCALLLLYNMRYYYMLHATSALLVLPIYLYKERVHGTTYILYVQDYM